MMLDCTKSGSCMVNYISNLNVVYRVANKIIELFTEVESLQVKFWLKKPFVVETQYCVTLDRVPEDLWDEVLQNKDQLDEWRQLYGVDPQPTRDFLREHFYLVLDTHHFSEDFKWRLLGCFDDLDEALSTTNSMCGKVMKSESAWWT